MSEPQEQSTVTERQAAAQADSPLTATEPSNDMLSVKDLCDAICDVSTDLQRIKEIVQQSGVDVNQESLRPAEEENGDVIRRTPLRCALLSGSTQYYDERRDTIVLYLVQEAGALPDIDDFCAAISHKARLHTIKVMWKGMNEDKDFKTRISSSGRKADANSKDSGGRTPLECALLEKRMDVVQWLLQWAGAKPDFDELSDAVKRTQHSENSA